MRGHTTKNMITGRYRDVCHDAQGHQIWDSGWKNNLVVQSCNFLLAALMKRETDISGISYWAIGTGNPDWDNRIPSPGFTDTQLFNEVARVPLALSQIVYIDNENEVSESTTDRLEITATFNADALGFEDAHPLREFGLFGGDASETLNSGFMIDFIIHPPYDLIAGRTLTRKIHLTFTNTTRLQDGLTGFGAALPVISIDGVGRRFSAALGAAEVNTLNDLLNLNPLSPIGNMPMVKLQEFRAKARMVLGFRTDLSPFMPLAEQNISSLLQANPETLSEEVASPLVTPESILQMQEALARLQVALDDRILQEMTLQDLIRTQLQ